MCKRSPCSLFWILAAMLLAACGGSVAPTPTPAAEGPPSSHNPSVETITIDLVTPQPTDVLLELTWEGGFTRQELAYAFGRVPEFSLLTDGSIYYRDPSEYDIAQVMEADLTPAETDALIQRLLELGIEHLESYTDVCGPRQADGCVADARQSVLRVRLPSGEQREIRNYYTFANDPEALSAIRTLLQEYQHPDAQPYVPEVAALFVRPVGAPTDLPILDWPLDLTWLAGGTPDMSCVREVSGDDLQALLAVTGRNLGDFYFRDEDQVYNVYLVPWLPGVDYTDLIVSSGMACPAAGRATPTAEVVASPCARASTDTLPSRLIIEEHPIRFVPSRDTPPDEIGWHWDILDADQYDAMAKNQAYRDALGVTRLHNNRLLQPFGYRLEVDLCQGPARPWSHSLYRGDRLLLDHFAEFGPASLNASGTDFEMWIGSHLLTKEGLARSVPGETPPSRLGDQSLMVTVSDTLEVMLGGQLVYQAPVPAISPVPPLGEGSPWVYDSHWAIEVIEGVGTDDEFRSLGRVVVDGQDLNQLCGYEQTFNLRLLDGRPFFFLQREGKIDISYDGLTFETGYDEIPHYLCCVAGSLNPQSTQNMVWFFALRGGQDYYVEALVPFSEAPAVACPLPTLAPTPAPVTEPAPAALPGEPAAGATRTRENDGMVMRYVPAGSFTMGSPEGEGLEEEYPPHTVYLDPFWIDQTEVTNAQYRRCVEAGYCRVPQCEPWDPQPTYFDKALSDHPVACVTWFDAVRYCEWAGGRLPSEAEWEMAARGPQSTTYPWGNEFDGARLNFCDLSCEYGPEGAEFDDGQPKDAPVGSFPSGASRYGALDMAGNVWEWANDWMDNSYYARSPLWNPLGPDSGGFKVARGGGWGNSAEEVRAAYRLGVPPERAWETVGLRCAASP
jgi:formylglycine-generating enzyme required for sulfatase activity